MKIDKIEIYGFKSFAEKTIVRFPYQMNGIIGPNGSGKSNIIDAIRWVLGEQSVKILRSNKIEEIIFAGSKYREPINYAKVAITFKYYQQNIEKEMIIAKEANRKNEIKYYINNQKVTLKEITHHVLKYNFSKDSLNIIGQGTITEIINSDIVKKQKIMDIATGVMQYKINYKDAMQKINRTNQDLEKLELINAEQQKNLKRLAIQKVKAEQYKILKQKFVETIQKFVNYKLAYFATKTSKLTKQLALINEDTEQKHTSIYNIDQTLKQLEEENLTNQNKLETLQNEFVKINNVIMEITNDVNLLEQEFKQNLEIEKINQIQVNQQLKTLNEAQEKINELIAENKKNKEEYQKNLTTQSDLSFKKTTLNQKNEQLKKDYNSNLIALNQKKYILEQLIQQLETLEFLPPIIRKIIKSSKFANDGILANKLQFEQKYQTAISVWGGRSLNNLIVEKQSIAQAIIEYAKQLKIGRVTIYPLELFEFTKINPNSLAAFIKCEPKYQNLINYLFGNVIVADDFEQAKAIYHKANRAKNVISLDGTLFSAQKSISGGHFKQQHDLFINQKIKQTETQITELKTKIADQETVIKKLNEQYQKIENELSTTINLKLRLEQLNDFQENRITELKIEIKNNQINQFSNEQYASKREEIRHNIKLMANQKNTFEQKKENLEKEIEAIKLITQKHHEKLQSINNKKRSLEKTIQANNVLSNEVNYKINQAKANIEVINEQYKEYIDYDFVIDETQINLQTIENYEKSKNNFQYQISQLGYVNEQAIEEYDLVKQENDILTNNMQEIISCKNKLEVDIENLIDKITKQFNRNFKAINQQFKNTFKQLFDGGDAELVKINEGEQKGVDIIVTPPGKKKQNINLLSGGEKTLATIALIVAIIREMKQSFVILDEVEAMLDETNVNKVGEILKSLKDTQIIMITHRKATMEYLDIIYGVTMEESGVTKILTLDVKQLKEHENGNLG